MNYSEARENFAKAGIRHLWGDAYYDQTDSCGKYIDVFDNGKYLYTNWYDENENFLRKTT